MGRVRRDSRIASAATRRSPRTRVRSLASIATSVPVPMASPRSAWASAAASLTPSPTMATTRPSAWSRLRTSTFSCGSTSAITCSMPTSAATDRAAAVVVAGQQDRRQAQGAQLPDRGGRGRLDRVGDHQHPARGAVPADRDRRPSLGLRGGGRPLEVVGQRRAASSRRRPTTTAAPSTSPVTPRPSTLRKSSTGGSGPVRSAAAAGDGGGDRVLRRRLQRAGQPQHAVGVLTRRPGRRPAGSSGRW